MLNEKTLFAMDRFSPNTHWNDARRFRAAVLFVTGILLWLTFGLVAAGVDDRRLFHEWDAVLKERWPEHARRHASLRCLVWAITTLGNFEVLASLVAAVAIYLIGRRERRLTLVWVLTVIGNAKLVDALKVVYGRPRPEFLEPLILESSPSFPSGHAAGMITACAMLAYLLIRGTHRAGWFLIGPLLTIALLVGLSRVYLGAHWLSDVVAGWLFGGGCVAFGMATAEAWRAH
jgi:undecaprenyl-diphosphatase